MATLTLQYLKTKKGAAYREKNPKQLVWIRTNHGYWGEDYKGHYSLAVEAAIYTLSEAYNRISDLGPEKNAMLRPVDIAIIDNALHDMLKQSLRMMEKKEFITEHQLINR